MAVIEMPTARKYRSVAMIFRILTMLLRFRTG